MQLLIPFAAPLPEAGRQALRSNPLPHLTELLAGMQEKQRDTGDELSLSTPHERALAQALSWTSGDGTLPWAAWQMRADGLDPGDLAWGLLTPAHWHLGTEQLSMGDPDTLALDEGTSRAVLLTWDSRLHRLPQSHESAPICFVSQERPQADDLRRPPAGLHARGPSPATRPLSGLCARAQPPVGVQAEWQSHIYL